MHRVNRQALVKFNAEKMFLLVTNIESYPEFLKWCHSSHVIEESKDLMVAGLTVSLAGLKQKFTTKNIHTHLVDGFQINLSLVKGPFDSLSGFWKFSHLNDNASKIELHLDFNFKSGLLNTAFKSAFGKIAQQMVEDFVKRANNVYS